MKFINLDCCNHFYSTANETYKKIERFKNINLQETKLPDGRMVKKEIILMVSACPVCKHFIIKVLRYASKSANFYNYDESITYRGKKADRYWIGNCDKYTEYPLPSPYTKSDFSAKQTKVVPFVFGKVLKCGTKQIPRYLDESANAGEIINAPLKIYKV